MAGVIDSACSSARSFAVKRKSACGVPRFFLEKRGRVVARPQPLRARAASARRFRDRSKNARADSWRASCKEDGVSTQAIPAVASQNASARASKLAATKKHWLRWSLAGAASIAIVVGGWRATKMHRAPAVHYQTSAIDRGPIAAKVTATGTLSALVTVSVGAQVSGRIATLGADFESTVKTGQVIATIEPSLFRAAVEQARANDAAAVAAVAKADAARANAEKQFVRAKSLLSQGLIAGTDYDVAEAAYSEALADVVAAKSNVLESKAALDQANLNLHYTTIVSPIDGIVISRNVDVGQTVAAALQAPVLFTIAQDLTHMQVDTDVAEGDIGKIHAGMNVSFTVDAYPSRTFSGVVRQVRDNAQTIQNVVTYDAVIDVDNSQRLLKPGMTASVTFVYATEANVLRVSNAALRFKPDAPTLALMTKTTPPALTRPDQRLVWISRAGSAEAALTRIGISDGVTTEIVEGDLHEGDLAIVEATSDASKKAP
jgi:HlyD family secretion protein